jgi:hypothetical protein
LPVRHGLGERENKVGIIVRRVQAVSSEINHLMARIAKLGDKLYFQAESTVIGGDSNPHVFSFPCGSKMNS